MDIFIEGGFYARWFVREMLVRIWRLEYHRVYIHSALDMSLENVAGGFRLLGAERK